MIYSLIGMKYHGYTSGLAPCAGLLPVLGNSTTLVFFTKTK